MASSNEVPPCLEKPFLAALLQPASDRSPMSAVPFLEEISPDLDEHLLEVVGTGTHPQRAEVSPPTGIRAEADSRLARLELTSAMRAAPLDPLGNHPWRGIDARPRRSSGLPHDPLPKRYEHRRSPTVVRQSASMRGCGAAVVPLLRGNCRKASAPHSFAAVVRQLFERVPQVIPSPIFRPPRTSSGGGARPLSRRFRARRCRSIP